MQHAVRSRREATPRILPLNTAAEVNYEIGGHPYRVRIWTLNDWAKLPESRRPREARSLGAIGWVLLERIAN